MDRRSREIETLSLELKNYPTPTSPNTTLRRPNRRQSQENQEDGEEELNLGLSLDGRFGVDKSHKGLVRSSSVAAAITLEAAPALARTSSLPPEMEEEWRRKKELQSLKRMEAKRKRSEKQRSLKGNGSGENLNLNPVQPEKCNPGEGSGESQGSGMQEMGNQRIGVVSSKQINDSDHEKKAKGDMPCVFTIGDGPKGRKVEGILYRYRKGEEVRIMCVCHGSFFTPAEFVDHAGSRNVAHPLKRIVVNPNASLFS